MGSAAHEFRHVHCPRQLEGWQNMGTPPIRRVFSQMTDTFALRVGETATLRSRLAPPVSMGGAMVDCFAIPLLELYV